MGFVLVFLYIKIGIRELTLSGTLKRFDRDPPRAHALGFGLLVFHLRKNVC